MARDSNRPKKPIAIGFLSSGHGKQAEMGKTDKDTLDDWGLFVVNYEGVDQPILHSPQLQKFIYNSVEELAERMKHIGYALKEKVAIDSDLKRHLDWIQYRPSSAKKPTRSLTEVLTSLQLIPHNNVEQIMDIGDDNVQMPTFFFEHHMYPTEFLRAYLGEMRNEGYAGGLECAFLYSFYMQHQLLPQTRNEEDIVLLRAAASPSTQDLRGQ
jgi:hypothetical protein